MLPRFLIPQLHPPRLPLNNTSFSLTHKPTHLALPSSPRVVLSEHIAFFRSPSTVPFPGTRHPFWEVQKRVVGERNLNFAWQRLPRSANPPRVPRSLFLINGCPVEGRYFVDVRAVVCQKHASRTAKRLRELPSERDSDCPMGHSQLILAISPARETIQMCVALSRHLAYPCPFAISPA